MLRVMLVDDEPLALEGLQLMIDWAKEGFSVCAACDSGQMALDALPAARPDLIVTDINMRNMNGLQLMAAARERGYDGAFIVVSGYSDFEYAQQAMHFSVAGYLIKPIDAKEASDVLEHVRKQLIDKELKRRLPMAAYQQDVAALLMGQTQKAILLPTGAWRIFTWGMPLPYEKVSGILDFFSAAGIRATTHIIDGREWLVLFAQNGIHSTPIQDLMKVMAGMAREYISGCETESAEQMLLEYRRICGHLDDCGDELFLRVQELAQAVSYLQHDAFESKAKALHTFCQLRGSEFATRAYDLFYHLCVRQLEKEPDKLNVLMKEPEQDILTLGKAVIRLLTPVVSRISDQVKTYLKEFHHNKLTLENVAAALGYNATYLGRVFREETGMGFREYLSDYRVQKAAELMLSSTQPVHRIADSVGYTQYKLFLAHFKRLYGKTPMEYRQGINP